MTSSVEMLSRNYCTFTFKYEDIVSMNFLLQQSLFYHSIHSTFVCTCGNMPICRFSGLCNIASFNIFKLKSSNFPLRKRGDSLVDKQIFDFCFNEAASMWILLVNTCVGNGWKALYSNQYPFHWAFDHFLTEARIFKETHFLAKWERELKCIDRE